MLVKELIEKLQRFNPEASISLSISGVICSEDIELGFIAGEQKGTKFKYTPKTTKHIFIEGVDYNEGDL